MNIADISTFPRRSKSTYEKICDPLCKEIGFPQAALDILLYIYNNPEENTAGRIAKNRNIKPNLISLYVEKLVNEGYLTRVFSGSDRRIVELVLTDKGLAVGEKGKVLQDKFLSILTRDLSAEDLAVFSRCLNIINTNLTEYLHK